VLSEAPENTAAESKSALYSTRGGWEDLKVVRSTGEINQTVWEDCMSLPDRFTFSHGEMHLEAMIV